MTSVDPRKARLAFDVSTLVRTNGQAIGIVRVVRELALWARVHRKDAAFVLYDREIGEFHRITDEWSAAVLRGSAKVDTSWMPDRHFGKRRLRDWLPRALRGAPMWLQHPRRRAILALERRRLGASTVDAAERLARIQERLMSPSIRRELANQAGGRRTYLPYDMATGGPLEFQRGDILVVTGSEWGETEPAYYGELKRHRGVRVVWLCHDIIPLLHPEFFRDDTVDSFSEFAQAMFRAADLVVFTARSNEKDARDYCLAQNIEPPKTRIVPPGADLSHPRGDDIAPLPAGLEEQHYALFVSTIEPRKGHSLLFSVWKRLLAEGVPQAHRFKLVFVGRPGWLTGDLMRDIEAHPSARDSLFILQNVGDPELEALYRNAAFCLYPSAYEGYGLPVVEAFSYGKAVLASTGGALPEIVGEFSPRIDASDEAGWHATLKQWIEQPAARAPFETAIRERFRHPTWNEAAREFFSVIDDVFR